MAQSLRTNNVFANCWGECWINVYPNYNMTRYELFYFADFYKDVFWIHGCGKPIYRIHVRLK